MLKKKRQQEKLIGGIDDRPLGLDLTKPVDEVVEDLMKRLDLPYNQETQPTK